jgi:DNA-binding MarR family transcriptional regulator
MGSKKLQTTADIIANECLSVRVRMLSRVVTAIYDETFRSTGLTANQFNMLVVMIKMQKPTAQSVVRILKMETSTVSRNLERMMKRGWITIRGQEGRKQELALTKKGEDLIKKALPAWRKAQARAQAVLGKKEFLALTKITEGLWTKNPKSSYQKK